MKKRGLSVVAGLAMLGQALSFGAITSISIPKESQDTGVTDSYAARDNIWAVAIPPYPFDADRGLGRLLNTSGLALESDVAERKLVLHSHKFAAPYVPVSGAVITFTFDVPTTVAELEVVQHQNGVARVEGFAGNSASALASLGNVYGPRGDARGGGIFGEGEVSVFQFPNRVSGTIFQARFTQSTLADGYAIYRAWPRNEHGQRLAPAGDSLAKARVSEIEINWWSLSGKVYNVEYSSETDANTWLPLAQNIPGTGAELSVTDKPPRYGAKRFYRVVPVAQ